jgi:hypothetical protein
VIKLNVSASWASGLSASCIPAVVGDSPRAVGADGVVVMHPPFELPLDL